MANAFDKNAPKKGNSKGKIATMIALAGVLGFLAFNHFNNVPSAANAAEPDNAPSTASLGSATEQIALLGKDPTVGLLLRSSPRQTDVQELPANPFAVSVKWYKQLGGDKPAIKNPGTGENPTPVGPGPKPPQPQPINLDPIKADIKLQMIFKESTHRVAIVNGSTVRIGAMVGKVQVVDILEDRITCQIPGTGDEGKFDVTLNPSLNH